jgi:IclR family acetate operon transcriptional repressor
LTAATQISADLGAAETTTDTSAESGRSVLDRAFTLLRAFSSDRPILSLGDLAAFANLPKSTTHRLAATLVGCGALQRYGALGYCVGSWLHDVGMLAPMRHRLTIAATPFLHELHEQTRATVHLGVSSPGGPLYLDKISHYGGPASFTRPGSHFPIHSTAVGKSLVAFSDEAGATVLAQRRYKRFTHRTLTVPGLLQRELDTVRSEQLSRDSEETVPGLSCVGAPVFDHFGVCVAAISVCAPTAQLNERRAASAVRRAAVNIGRAYSSSSQAPAGNPIAS